jgi:hypothetical protein
MNTLTPRATRILFVASIVLIVLSLAASAFSVTRVLSAPLAAVTVPNKVGFEGFLANADGSPMTDGTYSIVFAVYNVDTGGTALWSETQTVTVTRGLYAVELGSQTVLPTNLFDGNRWIGVKVGSDPEMTPRTKVSSVPFALNAEKANNANTVNGYPAAFSGTNPRVLATDGSGNAVIDGKLGIGTATPGYLLDVRGSARIGDYEALNPASNTKLLIKGSTAPQLALVHIGNNTAGLAVSGSGLFLATEGTDNSKAIIFKTGISYNSDFTSAGTERMRVSGSGNVGIGTTSPTSGYKLDVNGKLRTANNVKIYGSDEAWAENLVLIKDSGWGGVHLARNDPGVSSWDGNWGLGYTGLTGNDFSIYTNYNGTQYNGAFHISNSTRNVGIGTTNPSTFKLQVAGSVGPNAANTYDLGSSALYWGTVHYHTLSSHSVGVFDKGVKLRDGRTVSCLEALQSLKPMTDKQMENGLPHLDYATLPEAVYRPAEDSIVVESVTTTVKPLGAAYTQVYTGDNRTVTYSYPVTKTLKGEPSADLDAMISLIMCAANEVNTNNAALEQRVAALEQAIKTISKP